MIFIFKFCKLYVFGCFLEEVWFGGSFVVFYQIVDDIFCVCVVYFFLEGRKGYLFIE